MLTLQFTKDTKKQKNTIFGSKFKQYTIAIKYNTLYSYAANIHKVRQSVDKLEKKKEK